MRIFVRVCLVLAGLAVVGAPVSGQQVEQATTFRVFLTDGHILPSYGESAQVGDRLVFMLPVGDPASRVDLQLMSLPASSVDVARTSRYAESVRAAHYAATRGATDYAAMTTEVARALDELANLSDPKRRLSVAEEARRRLVAWSNANYGYRAADIQELAGLFDEVIAELRAAAGESQFSVDLVAGPAVPHFEPLLPAPDLRESIAAALAAADAADIGAERTAILRTALAVVASVPGADDLRTDVSRRLTNEVAADRAYARLAADLSARADAAMRRGDVRAVDALRIELADRDRALGSRRPQDVQALLRQIVVKLEITRTQRLALDHYALVRPTLLEYERQVRPILSGLDGVTPVLEAIRDMSGPGFEWLLLALTRLARFETDLDAISPPEDLQNVHATFVSAVRMARQACARRRQAIIAPNLSVAQEGSAAAAGAQLLLTQARYDLVAALYPPKIK